ncbi:hypothetical protein BP5796_00021 [Coleophoma crateriformis]|uniref:O-methyltransferase C-terminal domain-containing protein n=1 Tax=Coleophoma crateriformis TaxID=565419 RepID=A0A3D8T8D1_9HELO|nr:hypothetical protein BP5796_00021 [Coleophoma crateriformis]
MTVLRIVELSEEISRQSKIISDFLNSKGLEAPSFDVNAPDAYPIAPTDGAPFFARFALIDATEELHRLALGPKECLRYMAWGSMSELCLRAIYHWDIAKAVPLSGQISYEELASSVNLDIVNLRRIIRHAILSNVFKEPTKGFVAHSRISQLLAEDEALQAWVGMWMEDLWPAVLHTVDALDKWPESQEPEHNGFSIANGTEARFFSIISSSEDRVKRYGKGIAAHAGSADNAVGHLGAGYPWARLGKAQVIDVGGGRGQAAMAVAKANPDLHCTVQELPMLITPELVSTIPEDLKGRISFEVHDFLTPQTKQADLYLFRWIMHNWSDKYVILILKQLIPALKPGARILINEGLLPDPRDVGHYQEQLARKMDLVMLITANARSRDLDDWKMLFTAAHQYYRFLGAWKPEGSIMWIVEAEWTPS